MSDIPLIPVNTAEAVIARTNKWPVYSVTTTTTHEYADPNYTKVNNGPTPPPVPIPVPTPPPVAYPSGQGPALAPAGYTRALFEDFLTVGIDYTVFGEPAYNGTPGGTHGNFLTSHAEQPGDSLLHLKYYSDPAANNPANFNNAGAGLQTTQAKLWPVGSIYTIRTRTINPCPGVTPMDLTMGEHWPPEGDIDEGGMTWFHWGQGNAHKSGFTIPVADDDTNWHTWQLNLGATTITVSCDGTVFGTMANPDAGNPDVYGLLAPMFLSMQIQDGDPNYPTGPVTVPVDKQVDWITIDVLA